jgi:hypothetical protein
MPVWKTAPLSRIRSVGSAARRIRIVTVAVTASDAAITIVDSQFGALVAAYFARPVDRLCLVSKWPLERSPPPRFTSQPPARFGTTWCDLGPLAIMTSKKCRYSMCRYSELNGCLLFACQGAKLRLI